MAANQGQSDPNSGSNVGTSGSASVEESQVKQSRATDSTSSPDTASTQSPVSNPGGAGTGQMEDDTSTQQAFKQDPNKPADQKREQVEKQGQKSMEPENAQQMGERADAHGKTSGHESGGTGYQKR